MAQNNTVCHVGFMLFSFRHCCTQSVLSLANQCIPLIIIMAFEYSLVKQSLHNISLTPLKNSNNDTCRIPNISLGFNVIKFCFVDLGSPPLNCSWLPGLLRLVLWQLVSPDGKCFISHPRINGSAIECIYSVLKLASGGNLSALSYGPALGKLRNRKDMVQNEYS